MKTTDFFRKPRPPGGKAGDFAAIIALMALAVSAWYVYLLFQFGPDGVIENEGVALLPSKFILFVAFFVGLFRFARCDPSSYWSWLKHTPWEKGDTLPFESPLLHIFDILKTLVFVGLACALGLNGFDAFVAIAFGYLIVAVVALSDGDENRLACVCIFLLCLPAFLPTPGRLEFCLAIGAVLVITQFGYRRILIRDGVKGLSDEEASFGSLGNPFAPCQTPLPKGDIITVTDALALAIITATPVRFFAYLGTGVDSQMEEAAVAAVIVISIALARIGFYVLKFHPPVNILGRWVTRHLFIRGYDRIIVPSLIAPIATAAAYIAANASGLMTGYEAALATFIGSFLTFSLRPNMREWMLTGKHRTAARRGLKSERGATVAQL